MIILSFLKVVHSTIAKDLENSNAKVHEASTDLRKERIKLIKQKAKEITGEDIEIDLVEINTDVKVDVNVNELARTEGIVSLVKHISLNMILINFDSGSKSTGYSQCKGIRNVEVHLQ